MSKKLNITSPLRCGFHYQDIWMLRLIGEWLLTPGKFKWIRIEANPTREGFYLDDIVLLDSRDKYWLYQVKFKKNKKSQWNWDDFLKRRKGKRNKSLESLLEKWVNSFDNLGSNNIKEAAFVTNACFSEEIQKYLSNQKLDINKLKTEVPDLYIKIENIVKDKKIITKFFKKFKFIFENEDINSIEKYVKEKIYYNSLNATKEGVANLLLKLEKEARKTVTNELTIEQIRKWCDFDKPNPLNENFDVPEDFQLFDEIEHKIILDELIKVDGGIIVLHGKPGTGKSVYLSNLANILKKQNIMTIKHHYHINRFENNPLERLNSQRVIEAIKAQFKGYDFKEYLGSLANKDSKNISLREFISTVAQNLSKNNNNLIIIIDGLDHVTRRGDVKELKRFLQEIFYPQKGLWIIFGMQSQVKNEQLLQPIFYEDYKKYRWVEIRGLSKKSVFRIIQKNLLNLNLPSDKNIFNALLNKLYCINKGNPLHLRYILTQLKNRLQNILVTEYECEKIISFSNEIENYYSNLWKTLSHDEKSFLLTLNSVDFQFTYDQFIECISSFVKYCSAISRSFKQAEHLIVIDNRKRLKIYHDSFRNFLLKQTEWDQQRIIIKRNIKNWIENSKYENLKWAELRKLECDLDNNDPILKIDRNWLIDAIINLKNLSQIISQLELCSKEALKINDYAKAVKTSHLNIYYQNAIEFNEEVAVLIWKESFKKNVDCIENFILNDLSSEVLEVVADLAYQDGKNYIIDEILELLIERIKQDEHTLGQASVSAKALVKIIPYNKDHQVREVCKFIVQFADIEVTSQLFKFYTEKLLVLNQKTKVNQLLKTKLNKDEKQAILECCMKYDLRRKEKYFKKIAKESKNKFVFGQIYLILQGKQSVNLPFLPDYKDFPLGLGEYSSEHKTWIGLFYKYFLVGLIYSLSNKKEAIEEWIKNAPQHWSIQAVISLFNMAIEVANTINEKNKVAYKSIFKNLKYLPDLKLPEDREKLGFKFAFESALKSILKTIILIKQFLNDNTSLEENSYDTIISTPFFSEDDLFNLTIELELPIVSDSKYKEILMSKSQNIQKTINNFPARSLEYIKLAKFSNMYNKDNEYKTFLKRATNNLLGYGYHKDVYLFEVLDAIELCAKNGVNEEKIKEWIQRVISFISNVEKYTDGDETNHLPNHLAAILAKYQKSLLFKFHYYQADKENLYPAQDSFKYIIRSLPFDTEEEAALGSTALDKNSFRELKKIVNILPRAQESVDNIETYFGNMHYLDEESTESYNFKEDSENYKRVFPEALKNYLRKKKTRWDYEKYIIGWTRYWIDRVDKGKIYKYIEEILLEEGDLEYVSGELLDILYPLIYEKNDKKSFELLCYAQINNRGWHSYWEDKNIVENRWQFIKDKFPKKHLDFFKHTMSAGLPIYCSRSVDYLLRFNEFENAIEITEAIVQFAEELMVDIDLPLPAWAEKTFINVDELDLLLQRLIWPSSLVRERAATAIGNLLVKSKKNEMIFFRLLNWINKWKVESIIALSLLPIIKAFQICTKKTDLSFISINKIIKSVRVNSIIIEILLKEISLESGEEINKFPPYECLEKVKPDYLLKEGLEKFINAILPPQTYYDVAQKFGKKMGKPFIKIWQYNAEILAKQEKIDIDSNQFFFYGRHENDRFLLGFSTKVAEVYRSIFLRILHDFYDKKLISSTDYLKYSFPCLPIDLSFWNILPNYPPKFWPKQIESRDTNEKENIFTIQLSTPIESMIKPNKNNKVILAAEGAIRELVDDYVEDPEHSFSLIGFGYKMVGPNLPQSDKEIYNQIFKPTTIISEKSNSPLNFLNNLEFYDIFSESFVIKDLAIVPIVTRNKPLPVSLWQIFRFINGPPFNIVKNIRANLKLITKENRWAYQDNEVEIFIFQDWIEGLKERYEPKMPLPHGHYVLADNNYLKEILEKDDLRLAYILKTCFRHKKYLHHEVEEIIDFKLLNIGKIIL